MKLATRIVGTFILGYSIVGFTQPSWQENQPTPINGLFNPYELDDFELQQSVTQGRLHSLHYPVESTGILIPLEPMKRALSGGSKSPFKKWLQNIMRKFTSWSSFDDLTSWLGLHEFPESEGEGPYYIPFKQDDSQDYRMGVSRIQSPHGVGFTYSCATCHSANLFGRKVMGLTNRFPRANHLFVLGKKAFKATPSFGFKFATDATAGEKLMFKQSKANMKFVEAKMPTFLGLDTSLSHVALSLSLRAKDDYATKKTPHIQTRRGKRLPRGVKYPREEKLRHFVADSKPGVWWNVKYKNKWLLDGSVVSGNPILTNILWNEIGRGTDLHELEQWIDANKDTVIKDLTTAVFNAEAPLMTDFFAASEFDIEKAKVGQAIFENKCSKCHGTYEKAWDLPNAFMLSKVEQLETTNVIYPEQTEVKEVGTDPQRWQGMTSLEQLNDLAISKSFGIKVKPQKGYVPPPLVGIWARWPYFHNNSIPNLCALFTAPKERPVTYYSGESINAETDFDFACNGYPLGDKTPEAWKTKKHLFDTRKPGMSNSGHYKKAFQDENGNELHSEEEKLALIHYLQTL